MKSFNDKTKEKKTLLLIEISRFAANLFVYLI